MATVPRLRRDLDVQGYSSGGRPTGKERLLTCTGYGSQLLAWPRAMRMLYMYNGNLSRQDARLSVLATKGADEGVGRASARIIVSDSGYCVSHFDLE